MSDNLSLSPREREPSERINDFEEVVKGYSEEEALKEASRCLQCKKPTCIEGCPVGIDIKRFIYHITQRDYLSAYKVIREKNDFPSICGRVCPAEYQCRRTCILTPPGRNVCSPKSINIPLLERFIGDWAIKNNVDISVSLKKKTEYKVAVIGSGPAGLSCAGNLIREGVEVSVFESLHTLGGVLSYGIPSFRLPRQILEHEIRYLKKMGVNFILNCLVGKTKTLEQLKQEGFDFFFIGTGAGTPLMLNIPGENLCGIYSANEFLVRVNLMKAYKFPKYHTPVNIGRKVIVIGGGNTAIDAARCALRLQKINGLEPCVTVVYRRTLQEMPSRIVEIEHAQQEGVNFKFLLQPQQFVPDANNWIKEVVFFECFLGEPDESGRRRPVIIPDKKVRLEADTVIVAIGLKANVSFSSTVEKLEVNRKGEIIVDPQTMQTSLDNIYAGGDAVGGEGTVIEAMGMGKKAALSILQRINRRSSGH